MPAFGFCFDYVRITSTYDQTQQTKLSIVGLFLDIGKVQQWMCTLKVGKFIQDYAAMHLIAGLENILKEILTCLFAYEILELMVSASLS